MRRSLFFGAVVAAAGAMLSAVAAAPSGNEGNLVFRASAAGRPAGNREKDSISRYGYQYNRYFWHAELPLRIRAMVVTPPPEPRNAATRRGHLFVAGPGDIIDESDPLAGFEGRAPGELHVFSAETGEGLNRIELPAPPVPDGIAAAWGRLYLSLANGSVLCLEAGPAISPNPSNPR